MSPNWLLRMYRAYYQAIATSSLVSKQLLKVGNIMVMDDPDECRKHGVSPPKTTDLQDRDLPGLLLLPLNQQFFPANSCTYQTILGVSWSFQGCSSSWMVVSEILWRMFELHSTPYFLTQFKKFDIPVVSCTIDDSTTTIANLVSSRDTLGQIVTVAISLNLPTHDLKGGWECPQ